MGDNIGELTAPPRKVHYKEWEDILDRNHSIAVGTNGAEANKVEWQQVGNCERMYGLSKNQCAFQWFAQICMEVLEMQFRDNSTEKRIVDRIGELGVLRSRIYKECSANEDSMEKCDKRAVLDWSKYVVKMKQELEFELKYIHDENIMSSSDERLVV